MVQCTYRHKRSASRPAHSPGTVNSTNVTAGWADFRVDLTKLTRRVLCLSRSSLELLMKWLVCLSVPGDRQYNIPALSPLLIPEVDVSQGTGLTLKMKDVKVFGLLKSSVEKIK